MFWGGISSLPSQHMIGIHSAYANEVQLPPGIAHCKDPAIIEAYRRWHMGGNLEGVSSNIPNKNIAISIVTGGNQSTIVMDRNTPFTEPAYWYLTSEMEKETSVGAYTRIGLELPGSLSPLDYFSSGIHLFLYVWTDTNYHYKNLTKSDCAKLLEDRFFASLLTVAGKTLSDGLNPAKKFRQLRGEEQISTMKALVNQIKRNKNFHHRLAAAWSIHFLYLHVKKRYIEGDRYIKAVQIAEDAIPSLIGYKLAGPPYYVR